MNDPAITIIRISLHSLLLSLSLLHLSSDIPYTASNANTKKPHERTNSRGSAAVDSHGNYSSYSNYPNYTNYTNTNSNSGGSSKRLFNFFRNNKGSSSSAAPDLAAPRSLNGLADGEDSPVSPSSVNSFGDSYRSKKSPFDTDKKRLSALLGDHTTKNKSGFEKVGIVGKKPSPTGVTIPVITTSTLHSTPIVTNKHLKNTPSLIPDEILRQANNNASSFTLDKKFRPISKKSDSDSFILITADNSNFKAVNVANVSSLSDLKLLFIKSLGLNVSRASETSFRLTDFGCDPGEPLDDVSFKGVRENRFFSRKIMVCQEPDLYDDESKRLGEKNGMSKSGSPKPDPSPELTSITTNSSYATSVQSDRSYEPFATPQYLVENSKLKEGTDYLNFHEKFETIKESSKSKSGGAGSSTSRPSEIQGIQVLYINSQKNYKFFFGSRKVYHNL
ncbi:unnamed protein product [Ambrosiozyma monospora]|uniref:Unnamed protein product n=1 Tax=Ambrosiozyma monospora TaxID=43982 RepID=A0ACB5TJS4_AMBMO|nr:unnamed protein product [Ambrosiozyma monospora]